MEHRGIEYRIIQGIKRGFWKWSAWAPLRPQRKSARMLKKPVRPEMHDAAWLNNAWRRRH